MTKIKEMLNICQRDSEAILPIKTEKEVCGICQRDSEAILPIKKKKRCRV